MVSGPVSQIINTRFYGQISGRNNIIIDGGFGEIWRREFANKLFLLGRSALSQKNSERVFNLLKHNKTDIFSEDLNNEMKNGAIEQIENIFSELTSADEIGFANWIDLFSIRTRLPNYYSPEQERVDHFVISYMPLIQKHLLNLLFSIGDSYKKNGKLFKSLIKQNAEQLTKYPLVKGNVVHPFNSSSLSIRLHFGIKNQFGLVYKSKQLNDLFITIKEYIIDLTQSAEVRNCEYYDQKKIKKLAENLLSKKDVFNSDLDWFLSFELFRHGISK
jgi:hypothetical protein